MERWWLAFRQTDCDNPMRLYYDLKEGEGLAESDSDTEVDVEKPTNKRGRVS